MKILLSILFINILVFAQPKDSLYVEISGDSVKVWNSAQLNCCSLYKFEVEIHENQIKLIEIDTTQTWCKCLCDFNLCASLTGLEPGSYNVEVSRNYPLSFPVDSLFYVGSVKFELTTKAVPFLSGTFQSECLGNADQPGNHSLLKAKDDSMFVEFSGDTVKIWNNNVYTNCCSYFQIETQISEDVIKLMEIDTTQHLCDCLCLFNLSSSIVNLEDGHYKAEVYRLFKYFDPDTIYYIGSIEFDYTGNPQSTVLLKSYQSECLNEEPGEPIVYSNSFESEQDTISWQGYMEFRPEAPPDGGNQSVFISGGCIWPHAWYELPLFEKDGYYILRCWGKDLQIGGIVGLRVKDDYLKEVNVTINNKEWTYYQSSDTLYCPAGKSIELFMGAGGIIPSAMLVDNIEIVKIEGSHPTTEVESNENESPSTLLLSQNFPNPFNPTAKIKYTIPNVGRSTASPIQLKVYDILGNEITALVNKEQSPGEYEVEFDGSGLSSGIFFYILKSNSHSLIKKMILLR